MTTEDMNDDPADNADATADQAKHKHSDYSWLRGLMAAGVQHKSGGDTASSGDPDEFAGDPVDLDDPSGRDDLSDDEPRPPGIALIQSRDLSQAIRTALCGDETFDAETSREEAERLRLLRRLREDPASLYRPWLFGTDELLDRLASLRSLTPNFAAVTDLVARAARVSLACRIPLSLPPLLLLGQPGIGKTHYARRLAEALGTTLSLIDGVAVPDSAEFNGLPSSYRGARPGAICRALLAANNASPVLVIDEIDKMSGVLSYDRPRDALLAALEPESARAFTDAYLGVRMRADPIIWLVTANDVGTLSAPLLSRLLVLDVPPLTDAERDAVTQAIFDDLNGAHGGRFTPLHPDTLHALAGHNTRHVKALLKQGLGYAIAADRWSIVAADIAAAARLIAGDDTRAPSGSASHRWTEATCNRRRGTTMNIAIAATATGSSTEASVAGVSSLPPISVRAFLDRVGGLLQAGLPTRLWIEATVVAVRASAHGHTLELADAAVATGSASLRVFLPAATLATIRLDLGLPIEPALLTGMTTALLIAPSFSARWHLGGRIEGLTRAAGASLRQRLIEQAIVTLKREGLWDRQRQLPRPRDVTTVGVIHPSGAAGWADIAGDLARWERAGLVRVCCTEAPFEGQHATRGLVAALEAASRPVAGCQPDVIVIIRGGGSRSALGDALDSEALARAVCRCPIPVLVGCGHAIDRTLVDQVAWQAVDTPSKTLVSIAGIIGAAARAAVAHHSAIVVAAGAVVAAHDQRLEATHQQVRAGADRTLAASSTVLAACWSGVLVGATAARERCNRHEVEIDHHLAAALARAPRLIEAQAEKLEQSRRIGFSRAGSLLDRLDGGAAMVAQVLARATALLQREEDGTDRLVEGVTRDVRRCLDEATAALTRLAVEVETQDLTTVLQRGFALVTDCDGRLLATRTAAAASTRLEVMFSDGVLAVVRAGEDPPAHG